MSSSEITSEHVRRHCRKLVNAVRVIMDPSSTNQHRAEALQMCDGFKQACPFCTPCGLRLADKKEHPLYRRFGLQLLEHVITFRWKFIFPQEKDDLKESVISIISHGTHECAVEEVYIKAILSRMVVELIKLEWPQQWPDLLYDLEHLCRRGETQIEIVMFILLRMTEDIITLHTLPAELMYLKSTLMKDAKHFFAFVKHILVDIVKKYKHKTEQCHRVGIATLETVAGYLDWVALSCITERDCELLEMLCFLLEVPEVQLEAAECLLIAINRTGKLEDRKLLLYLFEDVPMHYILNSSKLSDGEKLTEKRYLFQKKLCMVMCALANLLCSLVGEIDVPIPTNFQKYLDSLIHFTTHSSLFLRSTTQSTWKTFLRHKVFSSDTILLSKFPKYLQATTINLLKVGFLSKDDSPSCEYSRMDFDSDEQFVEFFTTFCAQQGEVIRVACQLAPRTCFRMASEWLKSLISSGTVKPGAIQISPTPLQWDAMTFFFECVIQQINLVMDKEDVPTNDLMNLLQLLLNFSSPDPLILSCTLSNMHTLFPYLTLSTECLFDILTKLFGIVELNKGPRPRALQNARRHACTCIKELCQNNAELVLPNLEVLFNQVKQILGNELMLTPMEKSTLMEALISVSNELKDYDAQREFLEELMAPVATMWLSDKITRVLADPEEFLQYVGANDEITNTSNLSALNRQRISFCVSTILGVLKEARWPSEDDEAKSGGFVSGVMPNGQILYNNPCSPQVMKFLDNLLALISIQHNIHDPNLVARMNFQFAKALYRLEVTKPVPEVFESLHFISNAPVYKEENINIQDFFYNLYSNCFKILGHACVYMMKDFYAIDDLSDQLIKCIFANLDCVPDYKLTLMIRVFAKPLVIFCPQEEHQALLAPVLGPFLTSLHVRLSGRWHIIDQRVIQGEENIADDFQDSPEYQQEKQVRVLTRDIMGFITAFCLSKIGADPSILDEESDGEEEDVMEIQTPQPSKEQHIELSELGASLMQEEDICSALMVTVFTSLAWNDSVTCQRTANQLCWPLLKQMLPGTLFVNAVKYFFTMVLKGLQVHGDYYFCRVDLLQLAFKIYVALRPRYEELKAVMEDVPDIDKDALQKFDKEISAPCTLKKEEEARKDTFKRLVKGCFGKQ